MTGLRRAPVVAPKPFSLGEKFVLLELETVDTLLPSRGMHEVPTIPPRRLPLLPKSRAMPSLDYCAFKACTCILCLQQPTPRDFSATCQIEAVSFMYHEPLKQAQQIAWTWVKSVILLHLVLDAEN